MTREDCRHARIQRGRHVSNDYIERIRHSCFVILSSFVIRNSSFGRPVVMQPRFAQLPLPAGIEPDGVKPATSLAFTEGPAVDADGTVYFSDIENNRIMKLAPDGTRSVFREPSGRTNGQTFDHQGRLYHCEGAEFRACIVSTSTAASLVSSSSPTSNAPTASRSRRTHHVA